MSAEPIDHGVPVPRASRRGAIVVRDGNGRNLAIGCSMDQGPRGWIVVTDLDTGRTQQVWCPADTSPDPPYGVLLHSTGRIYFARADVVLEFDPTSGEWTWQGVPSPGQGAYLRFIEGPDGMVYGGSHGAGCHLVSIDPESHAMRDYGPMDPEEYYLTDLALDDCGWIYCGIGVARGNLVACRLATGERRQLIPETTRPSGWQAVKTYRGLDGAVYAACQEQWYRLRGGEATPVSADSVAAKAPGRDIYWNELLNAIPDGPQVTTYDMDGKHLEVIDPGSDAPREIELTYRSEGAYTLGLVAGPDGWLYGGSAHPAWGFRLEPGPDARSQVLGRGVLWHALTTAGTCVVGFGYSGGVLTLLDTQRAWAGVGPEPGDNPRVVRRYGPDINVPHGVLLHADGRHLLTWGLPGYGLVGGAVAIYDLDTGESEIIPHTAIAPGQSTSALLCLPGGDLVGGTTLSGGHGTNLNECAVIFYGIDWATRAKRWEAPAGEGVTAICSLVPTGTDAAVALARPTRLIGLDTREQRVTATRELAVHGAPAYPGLACGADGHVYAALSDGILRLDSTTLDLVKIAEAPAGLPITAGPFLGFGRLYFVVAHSHLWSIPL